MLFVLALVAAVLPAVVAAASAVTGGWVPHGDDATVALRTADVLDGNWPITGMRSTSGDGGHEELATHHPGPAQFYLLALPLALSGETAAGLAVGSALIAAVSAALVVVWSRRLGGALGMVVFTGGLLVTQWAIGRDALFRPFNPVLPLLPTYLALVLLWALSRGDRRALPPFVVAVTLLAQANLAFLPLAGALAAGAAGLLLWQRRTRPGRLGRAGPRERRQHHWAVGLGALLWLPSLVELLVHRPNNLTQFLAWASAGTGDPIGLLAGAHHLSLLAPLPGGFRQFSTDMLRTGSGAAAAVGLLVLVLLVIISSGRLIPQGRASSAWPARVALLANVAMLATASRLPEFPAAPYWIVTWLPIVGFTWAALTWRALAYVESASPVLPRRIALPLGGGLVATAVLASLLAAPPRWEETDSMHEVAREASDALGPGHGRDVQIKGFGFVPTLGASPAIAWQLHRSGWEPKYLTPWPFEEDAEHLWAGSASSGATRLYVVDSSQPELAEDVPAEAERVGRARMPHREGRLSVYVVPGTD